MKRFGRVGWRLLASRLAPVIVVAVVGGLILWHQQSYVTGQSNAANFAGMALEAKRQAEAMARKPVDCQKEACLALSFDDGPDPQTTPRLLEALEGEQVRATFFLIGNRVVGHEALVRHMYNDGDEIGNHSWSHPDFNKLKPDEMLDQINRTQSAIIAGGLPPPRLFRAPYGIRSQKMRDTIQMPMIYWNIDPRDWHEPDPSKVVDLIQKQARAGGIMILHDSHLPTAVAARQFIHVLKTRYHLVTVSELLQLPPDARGEYFGHPLGNE